MNRLELIEILKKKESDAVKKASHETDIACFNYWQGKALAFSDIIELLEEEYDEE